MSVDFAAFDLTELAVLDVDASAPQGRTTLLPNNLEDLLGKPGMEVTVEPMCCSCVSCVVANDISQ
ncbi:hypothetical protein GXW83_23980 [Streptacidiphilus sp. PB12-B1b]|uniref:hypothetical protein n=1 Tax=Streptacidiphilus sp. PB12-B1b TaxID=2705012 RepID=UPI0015F887CD|nr:hypothetical protein [Streptacidiphilus sp. PB12-B1b]QMU78309.1 hypothetical protein GXW83_23980 [Streptacidiphilus sp. PB12-B1b]